MHRHLTLHLRYRSQLFAGKVILKILLLLRYNFLDISFILSFSAGFVKCYHLDYSALGTFVPRYTLKYMIVYI